MKRSITTLAVIGMLSGLTSAAHADNPTIEKALQKRADLSDFYQAFMNTGVNKELQSNRSYTVFAPVNAALEKLSEKDHHCLYNDTCRAQIATVIRNHIVPGALYVEDLAKQKGGVYSIDKSFVNIGEPSRNNYTVDGHKILSSSQIGLSMLHKIDGVIITPDELAGLQYPQYASIPAQATTQVEVKPDPSPCLADGCPQSVSRTTTTTITGPVIPAN